MSLLVYEVVLNQIWSGWVMKEGHFLFNDTLNTFYLRLYGIRHMVKDHSDSEKGNPLPPHRLLFSITARVLLYAPSHRQDSTHHNLCYTSHGTLAGTRNSSMGPLHEGSIRRPIAPCGWVSLKWPIFCADQLIAAVLPLVLNATYPTREERDVAHGAMGRQIDPSWDGPIELFLVPASAPRLV